MCLKRVLASLLLLCSFLKPSAQVNQQTGSAVFSIPIFDWKDDRGRLFTSIGLSYSSGNGVKVAEAATNIGQGWNLMAGGVITRMQVGEPDDQRKWKATTIETDNDITRFPDGFLHAETPISNGCPSVLMKYPIYEAKNMLYAPYNVTTEDRQADYFSFQFNGKSGLFIVNNSGKGESLGDTKMKITYQVDENMRSQGIRTTITSFQIHDVDGLIYKFTLKGLTKILRNGYCDVTMTNEQKQPQKFKDKTVYYQRGFDKGPTAATNWQNSEMAFPWIVNSWHLTEIEDALTHKKISLTYEVRDVNQHAGADVLHNQEENYSTLVYRTSITKSPEIKTIGMPDGHSVTFNYGSSRIDMNGQKVLASIDVKYQTRFLSRHVLNNTYFILNRYGTPTTPYQKSVARLCLKSIQKIGPDLKEDVNPHIFEYYMGSGASSDDFVPPPFFYAKDGWGFFNGNASKSFTGADIKLDKIVNALSNDELKGLCFLRNGSPDLVFAPKAGYAKNGLLRQIIYPTGGTLSYEYEQNYGKLGGTGSDVMVGGVHVARTLSPDGGHSNGCANPVITNYDYVESAGGASSLWGAERPRTTVKTWSFYEPEKKKYVFPAGCGYKFKNPGILSLNQSISLSDWQHFMEVFSVVADIVSVVSLVLDVVIYAVAGTGLVGLIVSIALMGISALLTCVILDGQKDKTHTMRYNFDLSGFGSIPAQFRRVEVIEGGGSMGKTVTEFTSALDYAIWSATNPSMAAKQRYAPWAYGLPKFVTAYDANGYMVKQTFNKYNYAFAKREVLCDTANPGSCKKSLKCFVLKSFSTRDERWRNSSLANTEFQAVTNADIVVDPYNFYTGRVLLDTTFERTFKPNSASYLETITAYSYRSDYNYEPYIIKTVQSNGDVYTKTIKYQSDFSGTIISAMVNANMVNTPFATSLHVQKSIGTSGYINETVTEFTQIGNGDIKANRILEQQLDKPSAIILYAGPGSSISNYKEVITSYFDNNGGYVYGSKDGGNRMVRYLWAYNQKFVVATIQNVNSQSDKFGYTSFEDGLGGWTSSSTSYNNTIAITGNSSFNVTPSNTLSFALGASKIYTVSFWSTTSSITVGALSPSKSGPTLNGFTYYEYQVPANTSSVVIAGTGVIDELRLYPVSGRMNTKTYDPVLGKTSECDENNRITYYEYDNLGRMNIIRDEKKNILKMYELNSISPQKQNGCPGIYYSKMAFEIYTRSNCSVDYLGSDVEFTIPANKYTSTISQQDADSKAELDLLTNGQAFANANGVCQRKYFNTVQSKTVYSENCAPGYKGGAYTYTVPANRYMSLVDQQDANDMALMDIEANADAFANANPSCILNTDPKWEEVENNKYCLTINGALPAHQFMLFRNENPNSSTYNQTQWIDLGVSPECPSNTYYSAARSQSFTRNNCGTGYTGSSVTYTVAPGKYSSTVSQAAADQLAINEVNANGQNYANANGTCTYTNPPVSCTIQWHPALTPVGANEITSIGTTVNFILRFHTPSGFGGGPVCNINTSTCRPGSTRTVTVNDSGRTWTVTINSSGDIYAALASGTSAGPGITVSLVGSYTK